MYPDRCMRVKWVICCIYIFFRENRFYYIKSILSIIPNRIWTYSRYSLPGYNISSILPLAYQITAKYITFKVLSSIAYTLYLASANNLMLPFICSHAPLLSSSVYKHGCITPNQILAHAARKLHFPNGDNSTNCRWWISAPFSWWKQIIYKYKE